MVSFAERRLVLVDLSSTSVDTAPRALLSARSMDLMPIALTILASTVSSAETDPQQWRVESVRTLRFPPAALSDMCGGSGELIAPDADHCC